MNSRTSSYSTIYQNSIKIICYVSFQISPHESCLKNSFKPNLTVYERRNNMGRQVIYKKSCQAVFT